MEDYVDKLDAVHTDLQEATCYSSIANVTISLLEDVERLFLQQGVADLNMRLQAVASLDDVHLLFLRTWVFTLSLQGKSPPPAADATQRV